MLRNLLLLQAPELSGTRKCGLCGLQTFSPTPLSQDTSKGAPTVLTSRSEIKAVFFQGLQLLGGLQETTSACRTFVKDVSSSQASIDLSPFFYFAATSYVLSQGLKDLTELAVVASTHPNHSPVVHAVVSRAGKVPQGNPLEVQVLLTHG